MKSDSPTALEFERMGGPKPLDEKLSCYRVDERGCWIWTGSYWKGCNRPRVCADDGRWKVASRKMYERHCGPIPAGLDLDHLCMNGACVNPAHLEPVTHAENMRRFYQALRDGRVTRKFRYENRGRGNGLISPETAVAIAAASGPAAAVAKQFGVVRSTVSNIRCGISWGWATGITRKAPAPSKREAA